MKDYVILRGNRVIAVNGSHDHLANATTFARAESRAHKKAEVAVVKVIACYRHGIEVAANRRPYHYRKQGEVNENTTE